MKKTILFLMLTVFALLSAQNGWINEIHYDNASSDVGEFIEVAIQDAGSYNLANFTVSFYNGSSSSGGTYASATLDSFTEGATVSGVTLFTHYPESIQNGSPDGVCLDYNGSVLQFISYEGIFTATDGPANGMESVDMGVEEGSATEAGMSLQLGGTGASYLAFYWQEAAAETPGAINNNQTFEAGTDPMITVSSPNGGEEWEQGSIHNITWVSANFDGMIKIDLEMVDGRNRDRDREVLVASTENDGSWEWNIPADQAIDDWYTVIISDAEDGNPSDDSNAVFSIIAPPTATEVATLAELRAGTEDGTIYRLTGEAILTYKQGFRNQKYFQDATAAILIDDNNGVIATDYAVGDAVSGLTGTLSSYGEMLQFIPISDAGEIASSGNSVDPEVITLADFNANFEAYEAQLVRINGVSFVNPDSLLNGTIYEITDGNDTSNFRTTFYNVDYIGTIAPQGNIDMLAIANSRTDGEFLTSRNLADFLAGGLVITPTLLEFLDISDIDPKTFTVENTSGSDIIIENMNFNGSTEYWAVTNPITLPYTFTPGESYQFTVEVFPTTRELLDEFIYIETEDDLFSVNIRVDTGFLDADEEEINPANLLQANYPNPFNPVTSISYQLPLGMENAELEIYNTKGQLVKSMTVTANSNQTSWNGTDNNGNSQSSGVYLYKLNIEQSPIKKMTLIK